MSAAYVERIESWPSKVDRFFAFEPYWAHDFLTIYFAISGLPTLGFLVPELYSALLRREHHGVVDRVDPLRLRLNVKKKVKKRVDDTDAKTNAPKQRCDDHANDRVLPDQTDKGGNRIENHKRKNKQRNAPEYTGIPNAETRAGVHVEANQQEHDIEGNENATTQKLSEKQQVPRKRFAQEQVQRAGLKHIRDHRARDDDRNNHGTDTKPQPHHQREDIRFDKRFDQFFGKR